MVYCGRPSTSCNNCRVKKRRCDKALPECGQCRRMGHECGGYRDPSSLIFHDESSKVIGKARSRATKDMAFQESLTIEHTGSHSMTDNTILQPAPAQSTFSYVAESVFATNNLPLDHFNFDNEFNTDDSLYPLYTNDLDSLLAHGDASIESRPTEEERDIEDNDDSVGQDKQGPFNEHDANNETAEHNMNACPFSLSIDVIGLNFFLSHYVVRPSGPSTGFLDYTFGILAQEDSSEMLEGAIVALGLTGLAQNTQQDVLVRRATMIYARTKESLDRALAEPHAARKDSTIVTVLILALYEFSKSSIEGWKDHVNSASSLLALRGKTQFSTPVGIQIFKDVFLHTLMNTIYLAVPLPPSMRMLRIEAAEAAGASDHYWIATGAAVELLGLYRYIRPENYSLLNNKTSSSDSPAPVGRPKTFSMTIEQLELHLSQALEIDKRLETCFSECSPEWQFSTTKVSPSSPMDRTRVQGDIYHVYHDMWVANVWNLIRICRIMSNHAIGHLVLRGATTDGGWFFSNQYADRLQQVSRIMVSIRDDILASIPQQMGHVTSAVQEQQRSQRSMTATSNSGIGLAKSFSPGSSSSYDPACLCNPDQITYTGSAVGAYFASWALAMVGCMHCLEDESRAWTVAQLRRISSRAALGQAAEFANSVESNKLRPPLS